MSDPEVVYGFDSEGEPHALYPIGVHASILPTAFCGAVLANTSTIAELPEGVELGHSCKPTKAEKAEQKDTVTDANQPT